MENKLIYSIRNRSIVYLSIVFLFIIAVIFLVIRTYAVLALKDLEENNARIQMKRMENAFLFTLDAMQNNVQDWAIWDESYDYIKGTNPDYVANNLYVEAFDNLNIHHVIFFDDMGQVLNAISYDFDTMTETTVSEEMLLIIASLGIAENEDQAFFVGGMITSGEGPHFLVSSPILRSDGTAEINGNLVFIRNVNADEISYLSGIVELPLTFKENVIVNVGDILFEQVDGNYLQISKTIEDLSGNHNLMFQTIIPNDYGVVLDKTYNQIIIVIISIAVFFSLVIIIFLDRRVFNRLSKLSSNIQNLANRKNPDERLPLGGKIDEITVVSNEINLMLDKIRESEKEINKLAYLDHLTQQPNRLYFYDILNQAIEEAKIKHQVLSVLFLDLDFFKKVNDTYGHFIGDAILVEVSKRLMDNLNPESTLARTGGDEFLLLVKNTSDVEIELLVKKIIQSLKTELEVNELGIKVSTSIGIAMFPKDGLTRDQLIKSADNAMYQAKSSGKNTYRFWVKEAN